MGNERADFLWNNMLASERHEILKKMDIDKEVVNEYANRNWDRLPKDLRNHLKKIKALNR